MSSSITSGVGRETVGFSPSPAESLVDGFVGYLREQRGVSARTVEAYVSDVRRFLTRRGWRGVDELSAAEVSGAVLGEMESRSPASVRRYGCALRAFLRYCHVTGLNQTDLSAAVLPVSGRRGSLLPQGISPAQERALLRACDRRRGTGRRDYAVIVLMLRLGLRASEVAVLALDDLDWRAGLLTVHGKRAQVDQLPLPVDVGEAIASYLRHGRPRTSVREVFVRVMPPWVGLTRHGVTNIVVGAAHRAGLGTIRAHRLRHTAACDMLRAGASPAEIGQVLRHRSAGATAAYARVDIERLRLVARSWPDGAGS
jgi:site-specific recombinase XerD